MYDFETAADYIDALCGDPTLAILPLQMVADMRGVTRSAIDRMVRIKNLEGVVIDGTRYVRASSLIALRRKLDDQVDAVTTFLAEKAREGLPMFYEPVMAVIGLSPKVPADRTAIGNILGIVSTRTWLSPPQGEPHLLSSIVHRKTAGRTRPSPTFYDLAKTLGALSDGDDEDRFTEEAMECVWRLHSGTTRA